MVEAGVGPDVVFPAGIEGNVVAVESEAEVADCAGAKVGIANDGTVAPGSGVLIGVAATRAMGVLSPRAGPPPVFGWPGGKNWMIRAKPPLPTCASW